VGEEFDGGQSSFDFTPEHCRFSVERSLHRLQTEVLDIVLIHSDGNDKEILQHYGTLQALLTLKQEGKIRAVGMSHKTAAGGYLAVAQGADVIMATLNPDYTEEQALIVDAAAHGCGVLIKKAMRSGHGQADDLAFVASQSGVHSIVVGTTNPQHLEQNAAVLVAAGLA
jgi:aryl-alcohol dehydrogenase-like predicted oxidoreductase